MLNVKKVKDCSEKLQTLGRIYEASQGDLFMNWTCSGLRFLFKGSCLIAELNAIPGEEMDRNPFDSTISKRKLWPYIAVFVDDKEEPERYFEVNDTTSNYMIYSGEGDESHIITICKMSENQKGKLSLAKFITDGVIEKVDDDGKKLKIEFIGDSITCGFGNLSNDRNRLFFPNDENGWMSHAAIAARKLDAQFSILSYSGIAITKGLGKFEWMAPSMPDLYPYTDRLIEEQQGRKEPFTNWDFNKFRPDVIVLNLGTNDATLIDFNGDIPNGIKRFEEDYYNFLKMIRDHNGVEPWIICALGSMDYYLYDNIKEIAERFAKEQKDQKIKCFKYGRMRVFDGFGACAHPNVITQTRMGNEIADFIKEIISHEA